MLTSLVLMWMAATPVPERCLPRRDAWTPQASFWAQELAQATFGVSAPILLDPKRRHLTFEVATGGPLHLARLDLCRNAWKHLGPSPFPVQDRPQPVVAGERVFYVGGNEPRLEPPFGLAAMFELTSGKWRKLPEKGLPHARTHHASVFAGGHLVIWGGQWHDVARNDGATYNPSQDRWEVIPSEGAPSPRSPNAIAAGASLFVWGGITGNLWQCLQGGVEKACGLVRDGGVFDVKSRQWRRLPEEGAPSARLEPFLAWNGKQVIVFSGRKPTGPFLPDGALYDPARNVWTPMAPLEDMEGMRGDYLRFPSPAWIGERLVLVRCAESTPPRIEIYNPSANTWTRLTTPWTHCDATWATDGETLLLLSRSPVRTGATAPVKFRALHIDPRTLRLREAQLAQEGGPLPPLSLSTWTGQVAIIQGGPVGGPNGCERIDPAIGTCDPVPGPGSGVWLVEPDFRAMAP